MPRDGQGLAAAVADATGRLEEAAEQAELFASSPLLGGREEALTPLRRAGRPPGALNKTTDAWRNFVLTHYRSPLLFLGDLYTADPVALHQLIVETDRARGVKDSPSLAAVIKLQREAAEALAPYLHRKQPIAIDAGEDKPLPHIQQVIVGLDAIFPQTPEKSGAYAYVPLEVAGEKSQAVEDGAPSD